MTALNAIISVLLLSILVIVFALGLRTSPRDALYLFRRPTKLMRAMIAIYVIVPAFALALCLIFPLSPPAKFALIALTVSPIPPIIPVKQMKAGGESSYTIGLLVAASLAALIMTPLLLGLAAGLLGVKAHIPSARVALILLITIGLPLGAGMALRRIAPRFAATIQPSLSTLGSLLLLAGVVALIFREWRDIIALAGNGTLAAIAATVIVGLVAGHRLGRNGKGDNAALALAAATRHPGIAIAIATLNFPDQQKTASAAVLLFLLTGAVVQMPYLRWIKGRIRNGASSTEAAELPEGR